MEGAQGERVLKSTLAYFLTCVTYRCPHITLQLGADLGQPEAEAGGTSQRVIGTEGIGPSLTLAAMKTQHVFLKRKQDSFILT